MAVFPRGTLRVFPLALAVFPRGVGDFDPQKFESAVLDDGREPHAAT